MASFLSKRLQDQEDEDGQEKRPRRREAPPSKGDSGDGSGGRPGEAEARLEAPSKPRPKRRITPQKAEPIGQLDQGEVLDTGYRVPPKRRITPKVKQLREQLRSKLLAVPDEMDTWNRNDEKQQAVVIERLQTILKKMNVSLTDY